MRQKKQDPVAEELSRQMRALSLNLTPEQRAANSKKAWATRKRRIAERLGVLAKGNGQ